MREAALVVPFSATVFKDLQRHVREVRRIFDWPGIPYHDHNEPPNNKFNRWFWHNLPVLRALHHSGDMTECVSEHVGKRMKPSYCFLSMYGPDGGCPMHTDRPQCEATIDLLINKYDEEPWPLYVRLPNREEKSYNAYLLAEGEALMYSGTMQEHFRKPMTGTDRKGCDLAFFHFVDARWQGDLG